MIKKKNLNLKKCVTCIRAFLNHKRSLAEKHTVANAALIESVLWGRQNFVKLYLKNGADVNAKCKDGFTALHVGSSEEKIS